jgi:hypothetical protein
VRSVWLTWRYIGREKKQAEKHERRCIPSLCVVRWLVQAIRAWRSSLQKSCPDTARVKPRDWCPLVGILSEAHLCHTWLCLLIGERQEQDRSQLARHLLDSDSPSPLRRMMMTSSRFSRFQPWSVPSLYLYFPLPDLFLPFAYATAANVQKNGTHVNTAVHI